ncbi:MAG: DNA-processing protein DprA, partial [Thermodesulfobacteriota bacterium]
MSNSFEKYLPWLILREIPLLGNRVYKKLINEFQNPEKILQAPRSQLKLIDKISAKTVDGIINHKKYHNPAKKELELIFNKNIKIVTITDPLYPPLLKEIPDPPPFLTYLGQLENTAPCISVVGSRNATSYGLSTSENLSYNLALKGFQIVSGLARGIDSMAHKGALRADKKTIAVMGSGLNKIYPRENRYLFDEIAAKGTILSEFKINSDPLPKNFPIRNRIIAGLSCGSIIVEAAQRSGSLITARLANEYNREVFAVPGSIKSKKSQGTHSLLKQGAKLVENEMDIIDELHHFIHTKNSCSHSSFQQKSTINSKSDKYKIIKLLEPYPVHIDVLIEKSKTDSSTVTSQLLDLELEGHVIRHQGNYYSIPEE